MDMEKENAPNLFEETRHIITVVWRYTTVIKHYGTLYHQWSHLLRGGFELRTLKL